MMSCAFLELCVENDKTYTAYTKKSIYEADLMGVSPLTIKSFYNNPSFPTEVRYASNNLSCKSAQYVSL